MTDTNVAAEGARSPEADEVLRRIGRNLLLFQQIEHLLKHLTSCARFEGPVSSLQANHEEQRAKIHKQTLGQLVGRFADDLLSEPAERVVPENLKEVWCSFRFAIPTESEFVAQHAAEMKAVVDARNDLTHHFWPRWTPESQESIRSALAYLDEQQAMALPMRDRLLSAVNRFQESADTFVAFLKSHEFTRHFESVPLRDSPLVLALGGVAKRMKRADGWTVLATAGHIVRQEQPDEMAQLAKRYGHKTLKKLLQATGLFDIAEEPTASGGTRTVYRIQPQFAPHFQQELAAPGGNPPGATPSA